MFEGRLRRRDFGVFSIISFVVAAIAVAIDLDMYGDFAIFTLVFIVVWFLPNMSFVIRRLHDMGYSGLVSILYFVPLAQLVLFFILLFKDGDVGKNEYGVDPKGRKSRTAFVPSMTPEPIVVAPNRLDALEKLGSMRERGLLTDEEYAAEKSRLR